MNSDSRVWLVVSGGPETRDENFGLDVLTSLNSCVECGVRHCTQERLFTLTVATSDPHVAQLVDDQSNITQTLSFLVVPDTKSSYFVGVHSIITKILRFFLLPDAQPLFIFDPQSNITQTLTFLLVPNTESSLLLNAAFNVNETVSFLVAPDAESSFLVDARHVGIARLLLRLSADDNVTLASVDYTVRVSQKSPAFINYYCERQ